MPVVARERCPRTSATSFRVAPFSTISDAAVCRKLWAPRPGPSRSSFFRKILTNVVVTQFPIGRRGVTDVRKTSRNVVAGRSSRMYLTSKFLASSGRGKVRPRPVLLCLMCTKPCVQSMSSRWRLFNSPARTASRARSAMKARSRRLPYSLEWQASRTTSSCAADRRFGRSAYRQRRIRGIDRTI